MAETMVTLYVLVGIGLFILSIIMIVKFFQIASDIRKIKELFFKFSDKENIRTSSNNADKVVSNIISGQASNSKGDLNDPEVLNSLLGLINQQSTK